MAAKEPQNEPCAVSSCCLGTTHSTINVRSYGATRDDFCPIWGQIYQSPAEIEAELSKILDVAQRDREMARRKVIECGWAEASSKHKITASLVLGQDADVSTTGWKFHKDSVFAYIHEINSENDSNMLGLDPGLSRRLKAETKEDAAESVWFHRMCLSQMLREKGSLKWWQSVWQAHCPVSLHRFISDKENRIKTYKKGALEAAQTAWAATISDEKESNSIRKEIEALNLELYGLNASEDSTMNYRLTSSELSSLLTALRNEKNSRQQLELQRLIEENSHLWIERFKCSKACEAQGSSFQSPYVLGDVEIQSFHCFLRKFAKAALHQPNVEADWMVEGQRKCLKELLEASDARVREPETASEEDAFAFRTLNIRVHGLVVVIRDVKEKLARAIIEKNNLSLIETLKKELAKLCKEFEERIVEIREEEVGKVEKEFEAYLRRRTSALHEACFNSLPADD
ncbi:hypothetical protein BJ508DRAFT_303652 [Ascobolus immersus RN42]|uniref:Uncharacterized protein n=1 Tax=Ascobolus immersus RN42 TaxID=1160509 RepID=A0A3N4IG00_ASCIM|nr:hypothetical protein BJ508DRAFT_303652 [Ascobolus immersus RN42]